MPWVTQKELEGAGALLLAEAGALFLFLYYKPPALYRRDLDGERIETLASVARLDLSQAMESVGKALRDNLERRAYFPSPSMLPGYKVQHALINIDKIRVYAFLVHEPDAQPTDLKDLSSYNPVESLILRLLKERHDQVANLHLGGGQDGRGGGAPAEARVAASAIKKSPVN